MQQVDWASLATSVAVEILGEPKTKTSTHWRWGNKGSLALAVEGEGKGNFYDFEQDKSFTCHEFIIENGRDLQATLEAHGYKKFDREGAGIDIQHSPQEKKAPSRSFDKFQMQSLANEAVIKVQYSDSFWVMRFPDGHRIKQKYAPFSKQDNGSWILARPEAPLPIYLSDGDTEGSVLVVEGEKAMRGAENLYQGQVCCHHGGVNNWKEGKSDWTPIYGRKVFIWPDNDEAGLKFATELKAYLNSKKCQVEIIKIPDDFAEKDDLWDAAANNYFDSLESFADYIENNLDRSARGSFELMSIADMAANIKEPEWLIDQILERNTIGSIFGSPKSGKSLISLSMMMAISNGTEWFGHSVKQTPVVLFCGEGERSMHKRILAWAKFNEQTVRDNPFRMSNRPARILDDQDFALIMQTLKNTYEELGDIGCVCIDTLQRNWGGGDENSSSDMGKFIQRIDEIKYEFNANVVIVHHSGHVGGKSRARGSSVLPSSVDFEFQVDRKDGKDDDSKMYTTIKQTLNKEGADLPPINFEVVPVHNLKGYVNQGSATVNLTDHIFENIKKPAGNLTLLNSAIYTEHSLKIAEGIDPYEAMISVADIVNYFDDPRKDNKWVSKNIDLYKYDKQCDWVVGERNCYQSKSLLPEPFKIKTP